MRRSSTKRKGRRRFSLSTKRLRRVLSWKFVFYDLLLPVLRILGPARGDAILGFLGRLAMALRPRRRKRFRASLVRASAALDADWPIETIAPALAANTAQVPGARLSPRSAVGRRGPEPIRCPRLRAPPRDTFGRAWSDLGWQPPRCPHRWRALAFSPRHSPPAPGATPPARLSRAESALRRGGNAPAGPNVPAPRSITGGRRRASVPGPGGPARRVGDLFERRYSLERSQYLRGRAAGTSAALSGHLDRARRPHQRARVPGILHSLGAWQIRARDRSSGPPARGRGRIRRRRLPQAARRPDCSLTRRRRRAPRMAVLYVPSDTGTAVFQSKSDRRQALNSRLSFSHHGILRCRGGIR